MPVADTGVAVKLSDRLGEIQRALNLGLSVEVALDAVIDAFLEDIARREREFEAAAERSVGG